MNPRLPPDGASGRQIATGAAWMLLFKLADKSVGVVSTLILARLLVPADFGLVAMATAVVALTQLMSTFGFDTALIQRQDASRAHYDTAWTFNVLFGALMALTLLALALPAAHFYDDQRLTAILPVLAAGALAGGFENIGTVAFRKELDFRSEFRFLLAKRLVTFALTVTLAFTLQSYWALVAGIVVGRCASVLISYRLHPFRPRLSLAARGDLMHFSKWIFVSSLLNFLQMRSTDFILGRTVGTHGLGIYNIAYEIASMPSTEVIAPVNRAAYPAYARLAGDPDQLRERFASVYGVVTLMCFPIVALLFCAADPAVRVVLGSKWLETIPLIQLIAICGLMSALHSNIYTLLVAVGKPQANTLVQAVVLAISLPAVVIGSLYHGVVGAAWAQVAGQSIGFVGSVMVFLRVTGSPASLVTRPMLRPALASGGMVATLLLLDMQWLGGAAREYGQLVRLALIIVAGMASYPALMWLLWWLAGRPPGPEVSLSRLLRERLSRLRSGSP